MIKLESKRRERIDERSEKTKYIWKKNEKKIYIYIYKNLKNKEAEKKTRKK